MTNFTGTLGTDNFVGTAGAADNYYFDIANLGAADIINGGGTLSTDPLDSMYLSGSGTADFSIFLYYSSPYWPYVRLSTATGIEKLYLSTSDSTTVITHEFANTSSNGVLQIFGQGSANDYIYWNGYSNGVSDTKVIIHAGAGNDTVLALGYSTPNDEVYGEVGNDVLSGFHFMDGGAGNDIIEAAAGSSAYGGADDDLIVLQGDNITVDGGSGTDYVVFSQVFYANITYANIEGLKIGTFTGTLANLAPFSNIVASDPISGATFNLTSGGSFNFAVKAPTLSYITYYLNDGASYTIVGSNTGNHFIGGFGNNDLTGGSGVDVFESGSGNNLIHSLGGNDTITGGAGSNTIFGGAGDDTINVGYKDALPSIDKLYGEAGNDTFVLPIGYIGATTGIIDGGADFDTLMISDSLGTYQINNVEKLVVNGPSWFFNTSVSALNNFQTVTLGPHVVYLTGSGTLDMSIKLSNPLDSLDMRSAGAGDLVLIGAAGNDLLSGGNGNDRLEGGLGNDKLFSSFLGEEGGHDILNGGAGDDEFFTSGTDDSINGGAGNDKINAVGGIIDGGDGIDTIFASEVLNASSIINVEILSIVSSDYKLTTQLNQLGAFQQIQTNLPAWLPRLGLVLTGDGSVDLTGKVVDHGVEITLIAQTMGVQITATERDDIVHGSNFGDSLSGGAGDDQLFGGIGADIIHGGIGNDLVFGRNGADQIFGEDGNDYLEGGTAADMISGGAGDDTIIGGAGADKLDGGSNLATGDTLSYQTSTAGVIVNIGANTATGGDATGDVILNFENLIGSLHADSLFGSVGNNTIFGGDGNDTVAGGGHSAGGFDILDGGIGDDTVDYSGFTGNLYVDLASSSYDVTFGPSYLLHDLLSSFENAIGGSGNDVIVGTSGNNALSGGAGNDLLYGYSGNDTLIGGGRLVGGYNYLDGGLGSDTVDYSAETSNLYVDLTSASYVVIAGSSYTLNDLFVGLENIIGGSGNDVIVGTSGVNALSGGVGNDLLYGYGGNDTLTGGSHLIGGYNYLDGGLGSDTVDYGAESSN
jgi:Ca2+-binding RTX toxin-like protein